MAHTEDMITRVGKAAGVAKMICGVANNAAWAVVLEAHDRLRQSPRYKHEVKKAFKLCFKAHAAYERALLHNECNRMFHLADMPEDIRKKYGDITDRDYYDFWCGQGSHSYTKNIGFVTSLQNKYRLSLQNHGVHEAQAIAWGMTALSSLLVSVQLYEKAIRDSRKEFDLPLPLLNELLGQLSLRRVANAWERALKMFSPEPFNYDIDDIERRNIEQGIEQLVDAWMDPMTMYDSVATAVEDYGDVFRTKGEQKKALMEMEDIRSETLKELEKDAKKK